METSGKVECEEVTNCLQGRRLWVMLLILLGAVGVVVLFMLAAWRGNAVKGLATPAWENKNGEKLLVRTENSEGGALLLHCLTSEDVIWRDAPDNPQKGNAVPWINVVYRYDPQKRSLKSVGMKEWDAAVGIVSDEVVMPRGPQGAVRHDVKTHVALCRGLPMETAGQTALRAAYAPNGQWVAILSTTGAYRKPGMLFGGGGAKGQRFHEVVRREDCSRVGKVVPLDYYERSNGLTATWSADSKYVIYKDTSCTQLFIIPVESGGSSE